MKELIKIVILIIFIKQTLEQCSLGCSDCVQQNYNFICKACKNDYVLDENNICVYQLCDNLLYFQQKQISSTQNQNEGECVSICNEMYYQQYESKTCSQLIQCQQSFTSSSNPFEQSMFQDIGIYNQQYLLVINIGIISLFKDYRGELLKQYNLGINDLKVQKYQEQIFVFTSDQTLEIWNLVENYRSTIISKIGGDITQKTGIVEIEKQLGCLYIFDKQQIILSVYPFYDVFQKQFIKNINPIQFTLPTGHWLDMGNGIFVDSSDLQINLINLQLISSNTQIDEQNSQIVISCEIQSSKDQLNLGVVSQITQFPNDQSKFALISNTGLFLVFQTNKQQNECKVLSKNPANYIKIMIFTISNNSQNYFLIGQSSTTIDLYQISSSFSIFQTISDQGQTNYIDFELGYYNSTQSQFEIFVLANSVDSSNNKIYYLDFYQYNQKNNQFESVKKHNSLIQQPVELSVIQQNNKINYISLYNNNNFQLVQKVNSDKLFSIILSNFQSLYPKSYFRGKVNTILMISKNNILASCSELGVISFWDVSSGFQGNLLTELIIENDSCSKMIKFDEFTILAFLSSTIQLISIYSFEVKQKISHNSQTPSQIFSSVNQGNLLLIIDQCLVIYDNQLRLTFKNCTHPLISQFIQMKLLQQGQLVSISSSDISVYQLDLIQNTITLQNSVQINQQILLGKIQMNKIEDNTYVLDEIYIFTQDQSFTIYDQNLVFNYTISNLPFQKASLIMRTISDNNSFLILGLPDTGDYVNQYFFFSRSQKQQFTFDFPNNSYKPYEIQFIQKQNGLEYYHLQYLFVSPRFSMTLRQQFNMNQGFFNTYGYDFVPLYQQQSNYLTDDLSRDYIGTIQGFVGVNTKQASRYNELVLNVLSYNEIYQDIQQSLLMNTYFVVTNLRVIVLNIHTDEIIQNNLFAGSNQNITSFSLYEQIFGVVCLRQSLIQIQYFGGKLDNQQYSFSGMNQINNFFFPPYHQIFVVFGDFLVLLDLQLNIVSNYNPNLGYFKNCVLVNQQVYCYLTSRYIQILSIPNLTRVKSLQIGGQSSKFQLSIDQKYEYIFLYSTNINVYDLNLNFQQEITNNFGEIQTCNFYDKYLVLFTQSTGLVFLRNGLSQQNRIQNLAGLSIQKQIFYKELSYILIFGDDISFAQVFIYDLKKQSTAGKIIGNGLGKRLGFVRDIMHDKSLNFFSFLDSNANYFMFDFNDPFTIQNHFTIQEILDRKEQSKMLSTNLDSNRAFVLTDKSIFYVNYNTFSNRCQYFYKEPYIYYSTLFNSQLKKQEYLVLGKGQQIFRYSDFQFSFEIKLQHKNILDFQYFQDMDILVAATKNSLYLYQNYSLNYDSQIVQSTNINFQRFLDQNVILTLDKRVIFVDYLKNQISFEFSLKNNEIMSQHLSIFSQSLIIIGTTEGVTYLANSKLKKVSTFINQSQKSIKFFQLLNLNSTLYVTSVDGQMQKIDILKQEQVFEIDMVQQINRTQDKGNLILSTFIIDESKNVMMFRFLFEKKCFVMQLDNQQNWQYISFASDEHNQIFIGSNYYFLQSSFQVNIYDRNSLQYKTCIKRNTYYDQMIGFHVFSDQFLGLFFYQKLEIYFFNPQTNTVQLVDQQTYYYPRLIDFKFYSSLDYSEYTNNDILQIIGFDQNSVFEKRYNTYYYLLQNSDELQQCGFQFFTNDFLLLNQQLQSLRIKQAESYNEYGTTVIDQQIWKNFLFLPKKQNTLLFLNQQNSTLNEFFLSVSLDNTSSNKYQVISLQENYFTQFKGQSIQMKDISLKFDPSQKDIKIRFNTSTLKIALSNVLIQNQIINNQTIIFSNKKSIIIQNLNISNLSNKPQRILENQDSSGQNQNSLLIFDNVDEILIYDLKIIQNQLVDDPSFKSLLAFTNVRKVTIEKLTVQSNKIIGSLILVQIANSLTIKDVNIDSNDIPDTFQQDFIPIIFFIQGCLNTFFSKMNITNNQNLELVLTQNLYEQDSNIISLTKDVISFDQVIIKENLVDYNIYSLITLMSSNVEIQQLIYESNLGQIQVMSAAQLDINESQYTNNTALNGGALSIIFIMNKMNLQSSVFQKNKALGSGGAIYIESIICPLTIKGVVSIISNTALIGGGIRIMNILSSQLDLSEMKKQINLFDNQADIFGNDLASQLTSIGIEQLLKQESSETDNSYIQFIPESKMNPQNILNIYSIKSGGPLNLKIQLFDDTNRSLSYSKQKVQNNEYPLAIIREITFFNIQLIISDFKETQISGESILNYNLFNEITNSFDFDDVVIYGNFLQQQQIQILVQVSNYISKTIQVNIHFRKCLTGEIIGQLTQIIQICQFCQVGTYSLVDPNSFTNQKQQACKQCPQSAIKCEGNQIQLKNGYWRKNSTSELILQCDESIGSCQAQNPENIQYCERGYVGPLCEECDMIGDVWVLQYTKRQFSKGQCQECSSFQLQLTFIILKLMLPILYLIFTTRIFMNSFIHAQTCYYLRFLKLLPLSKSQIRDESGFYLKIILTYMQYSSLLVDNLNYIPIQINFMPNFVGTSISQLVIGIECVLPVHLLKKIGKLGLLCYIQTSFPAMLVFIGLIYYLVCRKIYRFDSASRYYIYTILTIIFTFFQPEIVSQFTKILTCRQIGDDEVFTQDLRISCNDPYWRPFINYYAILNLVFWNIIPVIIFFFFYKNKQSLNSCMNKYKYGYFYMELKLNYYYWEFVRMFFKVFIITIFTLQKQTQYNIAVIQVIIILVFYHKNVQKIKPFISQRLCSVEILSIECIIIKISLQYITRQINLSQLETLIIVIDYLFISYIILVIFMYKMNNRFSLFGRITRYLIKKATSQSLYLKITKTSRKSFRTLLLWKKLKESILVIIQLKANQNLSNQVRKPQMNISNALKLKQSTELSPFQEKKSSQFKMDNQFENGQDLATKKDFTISSPYYEKKINLFQLDSQQDNKQDFLIDDLTESVDIQQKNISEASIKIALPKDCSFLFQNSFAQKKTQL